MRHKYYVARECFKRGLYWRGLVHDMSKFRPSEFIPYANYFYGERTEHVEKTFKLAWLYHQKRNKHHWQYWLLQEDGGKLTPLEMPKKYAVEMVCDWIGAGMAIHGKNDIAEWYNNNKDKIILHQNTRKYIEQIK